MASWLHGTRKWYKRIYTLKVRGNLKSICQLTDNWHATHILKLVGRRIAGSVECGRRERDSQGCGRLGSSSNCCGRSSGRASGISEGDSSASIDGHDSSSSACSESDSGRRGRWRRGRYRSCRADGGNCSRRLDELN